jgi:hypothetical protein
MRFHLHQTSPLNMICINGQWVWIRDYYDNLVMFLAMQIVTAKYRRNAREIKINQKGQSSCDVYA